MSIRFFKSFCAQLKKFVSHQYWRVSQAVVGDQQKLVSI